ncbi:hypothetical protein ACIRLA_33845 [Streptomyces sp. NPDC102364]|uniref:hypothetical protein n=1 Tax=Streptomyces sp. NPDC102364 TaxID=3366161 RepID=UPI00381D96F8
MAIELTDDLIKLQREADDEGKKLEHLDNDEREKQREVWFEAAAKAQAAVTKFVQDNDFNRYGVEKQLRQVPRHPHPPKE